MSVADLGGRRRGYKGYQAGQSVEAIIDGDVPVGATSGVAGDIDMAGYDLTGVSNITAPGDITLVPDVGTLVSLIIGAGDGSGIDVSNGAGGPINFVGVVTISGSNGVYNPVAEFTAVDNDAIIMGNPSGSITLTPDSGTLAGAVNFAALGGDVDISNPYGGFGFQGQVTFRRTVADTVTVDQIGGFGIEVLAQSASDDAVISAVADVAGGHVKNASLVLETDNATRSGEFTLNRTTDQLEVGTTTAHDVELRRNSARTIRLLAAGPEMTGVTAFTDGTYSGTVTCDVSGFAFANPGGDISLTPDFGALTGAVNFAANAGDVDISNPYGGFNFLGQVTFSGSATDLVTIEQIGGFGIEVLAQSTTDDAAIWAIADTAGGNTKNAGFVVSTDASTRAGVFNFNRTADRLEIGTTTAHNVSLRRNNNRKIRLLTTGPEMTGVTTFTDGTYSATATCDVNGLELANTTAISLWAPAVNITDGVSTAVVALDASGRLQVDKDFVIVSNLLASFTAYNFWCDDGAGTYIPCFAIDGQARFRPAVNNTTDVGSGTFQVKDMYMVNAPTVSSAYANKANIADITVIDPVDFVKTVKAQQYTLVNGQSGRTHLGFVADTAAGSVKAYLDAHAVDMAAYIQAPKNTYDVDGNLVSTDPVAADTRALRYTEMIAPLWATVQTMLAGQFLDAVANVAAAPVAPVAGQVVWNTADAAPMYWNGTGWMSMASVVAAT